MGNQNYLPSDYPNEPRLRDLPFNFKTFLRWPALLLIRGYQKLISPALPANTCRFYPSCSHYGYQSVYKHGAILGGLMAIWRVLRCNPFNAGGYDPVPDEVCEAFPVLRKLNLCSGKKI